MNLIQTAAPDFTAPAVLETNELDDNFNLYNYIDGTYAILFFYPADFTFVCPTELIELDRARYEFQKRNTSIVGISTDTHYVHYAWKNTPAKSGGVGNIQFPLVADITKDISNDYGVLMQDGTVALRATFLIDRSKIIRYAGLHDLPVGRSINEILRLIDAVQFTDLHGEVCPMNWEPGKDAMPASHEGVSNYLTNH